MSIAKVLQLSGKTLYGNVRSEVDSVVPKVPPTKRMNFLTNTSAPGMTDTNRFFGGNTVLNPGAATIGSGNVFSGYLTPSTPPAISTPNSNLYDIFVLGSLTPTNPNAFSFLVRVNTNPSTVSSNTPMPTRTLSRVITYSTYGKSTDATFGTFEWGGRREWNTKDASLSVSSNSITYQWTISANSNTPWYWSSSGAGTNIADQGISVTLCY
jgi:hypothetical protein